jgi:hypothetical protein
MFCPIKPLQQLDPKKVTGAQALRIFTSKKKFLVLAPEGGFHLTNDPKRLVMENYNVHDAYEVEVYDLS